MLFRKIILKCTNILRGIECVTIHCSAQTSPEQVLLKMSQVFISWNKYKNVNIIHRY